MIYTMIKTMTVDIVLVTNVLSNFVMFLFSSNVTFNFSSPLICVTVSVWDNVILFFICQVTFKVVELFELLNFIVSELVYFSLLLNALGTMNVHHSPIFCRKESCIRYSTWLNAHNFFTRYSISQCFLRNQFLNRSQPSMLLLLTILHSFRNMMLQNRINCLSMIILPINLRFFTRK